MLEKTWIVATLGASWGMFAQATSPPFAEWGNLTALGALITVLVFIVTKLLPNLIAKIAQQSEVSLAAMNKQSETFSVTMKEMHAAHLETMKSQWATLGGVQEEMKAVREHCAQHKQV